MFGKLIVTDLRPTINLVMMILYSSSKVPEEPAMLRVVGSGDKCRIIIQFLSGQVLEVDTHDKLVIDDSVNLELVIRWGGDRAVLFKSCYVRNGVIYLDYVMSI
ncbi:MAG: hypothetical protein GXO23_07080 [Crenarchaeota archaeon]|nr:hypothetical protein [Thermoproteota archaeon]